MSPARGILDAQLQSLLDLVERHRDEQCRAIRERADAKCRQLLSEAHREARERMHQVILAERRRGRAELTAARAQRQTRTRQRQYRIALGLLREGWDELQGAVKARWSTIENRRSWIRALVAQALVVLPPTRPWRIEYPADWDPSEMDEEMARMTDYCERAPELVARPDLEAGLRFSTDGACLDGSVAGLLTSRTALESRLLAEFNTLLGADVLDTAAGVDSEGRDE